jgi:hypothetical protein
MKAFLRAFLPTATATIALATTALMITPAFSQNPQETDGVDGFGHAIKRKPDYHQPARNEGAYNEALKRIPDAKDKPDPWGTVREKPASK